jgi:hypothetical protein
MNTTKLFTMAVTLAAFSVSAMAADGYRPQNAAQRNYKACKADAMSKGVELVGPFCGTLPSRPVFPDYDTAFSSKLSQAELDAFSSRLGVFKSQVAQYQSCINNRVMADGSLPTETLNYAACADQWAVEQKGESAEEWGFSCLGQNDWENPGSAVPMRCFAEEE